MTKFDKALREALEDYGAIGANWRFRITGRLIIGESDVAMVSFAAYPPRKQNPYCGSVKVNIVRNLIYWDTYTISQERIRAEYIK